MGDYRYSKTLETSGIVWDEETIDALVHYGPDHDIPGNKVAMHVIAGCDERKGPIAFPRDASGPAQQQGEDE